MLRKWVTAITPMPECERKWSGDSTQQNPQKVKGRIIELATQDAPVSLVFFSLSLSFSQLHHAQGTLEASLLDCSKMNTMSDFQKQEDRWGGTIIHQRIMKKCVISLIIFLFNIMFKGKAMFAV